MRTLLKGYYGFHNAGDDALLLVTAWGVRTYCHADEVYAAAAHIPLRKMAHVRPVFFPDWPYLWRYNAPRQRRIARTSQMIIWGGGSIFHSKDSIDECRSLLNHASSAKAVAVGVSIGPFRDRQSETACRDFLSCLSYLGVRDRISYERALAMTRGTRVEMTFDLAPLLFRLLPCHAVLRAARRRGLGISLCNYERFVGLDPACEAVRLQVVAEAIRLAAASGAVDKVILFDFNRHHRYGDQEVHKRLSHLISTHVRVTHRPYNDDPLALMEAVSGVKAMLSMRLHASIFAFCTRTPTVILSYHEKCREWANMIGQPGDFLLDARNLDARELAKHIVDVLDDEVEAPVLSPEEAHKMAMTNWSNLNISL